jgi:microsomal epoxide hydrolase
MEKSLRISFTDESLRDLKDRLARVRWPDEPPDAGWRYGTNLAYLQELVDYWRDSYDWRATEAVLNRFHHYAAPVSGIELHFIHERGVGPAPLPLLLSHGWPSSILEFTRLIPMLTDPARFGGDPADAFTVVAPSLPGYGLSFKPRQPRLDIAQIAGAFAALMSDVLGYRRFGAHGGDWGAHVSTRLAHSHASLLAGIHLTMLILPREQQHTTPSTEEQAYAETLARWNREESGYAVIQGTKPQTLAYGLSDSPVGLAAWLVEKFCAWSDCGGDVERRFDKDTLLDTITLYWLTGCINGSFWPYFAMRHGSATLPTGARIKVPTGYAQFPAGSLHAPRSLAQRTYEIHRWTEMPAGGHYPALEEPAALVAEIREFFRPLRAQAPI